MDSPEPEDKDYTAEWLSNNHETPSGSTCDIRDAHETFASRFYHCCVAKFRDFCQYRERQTNAEASKSNLWDELARLYMWGEYFKDGELDVALAPSEALASKVISLLSAIGKRLLRYSASNEPNERAPGFLVTSELPSLIEQAEVIISGPSGEELSNTDDWDDEDDSDSESTSIQEEAEFCEDVEFNTRCLMQLVPALEQNIVSSRKPRIPLDRPTSQTFSVSEPASTYISLAQQRFQDADLKLVQRLGEANWQRHVRLCTKLYGHQDERNEPSAPIAGSIFHDSGLGTTIPGSSQYVLSLASHASFASSVGKQGSPFLQVPPMPPEIIAGQKFVCALCGTTQSRIRNRIDWKMRVFRDLKPYICTFSECSLELVQFSTRAQWADHEFSCHRFVEDWGCPFCSTKDIQDRQGCEQHLERSHGIQHRELAYWANRARTQRARMMNVEECLLCRTFPAESRQAFIKHCCRHMEEIALMAMPQIADAGSEGDDNSDVERSTRSSGHSAYISSSNDAQPSRRDANAPIVAPMKHTGSTMNESPSTVIPSASNPVIGDEGRPRIDPTPELLGGFQTEQERAMVKSESATHKCSICDKRYKREYYYKKHMETHNPQRTYPYPCTAMNGDQQCTKKFQRKRYLDRHHESVHFKASAPTTSQPPPGALGSGHQSPHGEATYFDTTLTRDKLQLPPGKKRKEKTQADPAGIPGQSAPRPRAQDHRCGLCGNRFNRQDTLREHLEDSCPKRFGLGDRGTDDVYLPRGRDDVDLHGIDDVRIIGSHQAILDPNTSVLKDSLPARDRQSLETAKRSEIDHSNLDEQGLDPSSTLRTKDEATAPERCHSCNRAETPQWRRGPDGPGTLCNSCGLHYAKLLEAHSKIAQG